MDSAAREARVMARERDTDESRCPLVLLPPEMKHRIMSQISPQESLSRLGQSCRAWHEVANEELYKRDFRENNSFAIKWMAAHAVDKQTTDSAIRTLEISLRYGGHIDAVKQCRDSRSDTKEKKVYDTSTALHIAVFFGNMRLTKILLDMKASLSIRCPVLSWKSMDTQDCLHSRFGYFQKVFQNSFEIAIPVFPIFLAFLKSDTDMCKLLIEHGAGREAMILGTETDSQVMSILHFAAADPTTDYRQWQCLFDKFREYIDEPCPRRDSPTPLHVALMAGCTQGMQIAVEFGADKEARNGFSQKPLSSVALENADDSMGIFETRSVCIQKFVELGARLDSEVDSLLLAVVRSYSPNPFAYPLTRRLIYFLLRYRKVTQGTSGWQNAELVNEIVGYIFDLEDGPGGEELLQGLLRVLVEIGLKFTAPRSGWPPSPLFRVLDGFTSHQAWFIHLFCHNGATIHEHELDQAFICWCQTTQMWARNKYDAWWLYQGQEDEIFQKWCKHPYNVWWWQHVEKISPTAVRSAYSIAFGHKDRHFCDILTHLPLPAPSDDVLVELAFKSCRPWAWRLVLLHEFEDDFVVTWHPHRGENMIHLTVHLFIDRAGNYPAADAIQDILYLRNKGVDMTARNAYGITPLESLLKSDTSMYGFMEVAALLEGNEHKTQGPVSGLSAQ